MALKAYSYTESEHMSLGVHDRTVFEREKLLAFEFVDSHPFKPDSVSCPFCESDDIENFSDIGGATYLRCKNCWSIYTPLNEDIISKYLDYAPLWDYRMSKKYQDVAEKKRATMWQEQLFWIEFRTARYLKPLRETGITEIGGRFEGFSELIKTAALSYNNCQSISKLHDKSDIILYLGLLMMEPNPTETLKKIRKFIKKDGLLFLNTRVSTGFDFLTLKGHVDSIYPYDCSTIPSIEALELVLTKAGFEILEISTPGTLDMLYVSENKSKLERGDLFTRYLIEKTDDSTKSEFQRLLQKSMMSSHAQLVARARDELRVES
jgi:hypothetical protein